MLPEKDGPCRPFKNGFRLRAGSAAVEGFWIIMPPFKEGFLIPSLRSLKEGHRNQVSS